MLVRAGDIRQLTVDGREMTVKGGDANVTIMLSGFNNEISPAGNNNVYATQRRKVAGFSDCPVVIDDDLQDMEYLQNVANAGELVPVTMTLTSNVVYSGNLMPVSEIDKKTGDGTHALEMRGSNFEQL